MPPTRNSGPEHSDNLASTIKITTNLLLVAAFALIACCLFSMPAHAQGSLPLGSIQILNIPTGQTLCSQGIGWYSYSTGTTTYYMNCSVATVTCSNAANLNLTFGYLNPVGIVPGITQAKGVIVYVNGDGGTSPGNTDYVGSYFTNGYEVVEMAWSDDWEMTYDPFPVTMPPTYGNVQDAACRPATFLNYVYNNIFNTVLQANSAAGMCAHGDSAGSAAIAYSLAYYGAGSYLDNVELVSGPVTSNVGLGCEFPVPAQVTVCGLTNYDGGQYGCQLGPNGSTWTLSPTYLPGANVGVGKWTNDMTCANANMQGTTTTTTSYSRWLAEDSIVDQGTGPVPTFSYPNTAMSGWLCRSVSNGSPNNSSSQGQIFYANIGVSNSPPKYAVYAVDNCDTAEGVEKGTVPGFYSADFQTTPKGFDAITDDMMGLPPKIPAQCVRRPH